MASGGKPVVTRGISRIVLRFGITATHKRGKITAQPSPPILHWMGTRGVATMTTPTITTEDTSRENQKRLRILGPSLKKFERSTSFLVALHVMLYENMCARIA